MLATKNALLKKALLVTTSLTPPALLAERINTLLASQKG